MCAAIGMAKKENAHSPLKSKTKKMDDLGVEILIFRRIELRSGFSSLRLLEMTTITTKTGLRSSTRTGAKGQPIVSSRGWPLSADDRDTQML